jgi:hypothetical protein
MQCKSKIPVATGVSTLSRTQFQALNRPVGRERVEKVRNPVSTGILPKGEK